MSQNEHFLGNFEIIADTKQEAKIYIDTLEPYTGYGNGRFIVSSVKQIYGTEHYYRGAVQRNTCQIEESISECFEREYSTRIVQECQCIPFDSYQALALQVIYNLYLI